MASDRAAVRAFKTLFREARVATLAQVRRAVAPETIPDLTGWLGARGLTKYYEVRGEACDLPESIGQLRSLHELNLRKNRALSSVPDSLERWLKALKQKGCTIYH
jgi:hypothetical protein